MIAAIVLAAGSSSRLGQPKQNVMLQGESLLARAVRIAHEARCTPVVAVVPPIADGWADVFSEDTVVVRNEQATEGIAASIRCGVEALKAYAVAGTLILACDQPAQTAEHLLALSGDPSRRTGSAYAGRIGVPAYFPAEDFPQLLTLRGDRGARELLQGAVAIANEALAFDIDTPADLARLLDRE